jgi:hypothetical protein
MVTTLDVLLVLLVRSLVRHKSWNCHRFEDSTRRPADHEFAHARMAIASHDDQVRRAICRVRQNRIGHIEISGGLDLRFRRLGRVARGDCRSQLREPCAARSFSHYQQ